MCNQPERVDARSISDASAPEHTDQLQHINQKIIASGENLPVVKLKDGSQVQTGTIATMLHNISSYNAGMRGQVERELELAVPTLIKVGLFKLFSVDEWINTENPGRRFVGEKTKAYLERQAVHDKPSISPQ